MRPKLLCGEVDLPGLKSAGGLSRLKVGVCTTCDEDGGCGDPNAVEASEKSEALVVMSGCGGLSVLGIVGSKVVGGVCGGGVEPVWIGGGICALRMERGGTTGAGGEAGDASMMEVLTSSTLCGVSSDVKQVMVANDCDSASWGAWVEFGG